MTPRILPIPANWTPATGDWLLYGRIYRYMPTIRKTLVPVYFISAGGRLVFSDN